MWQDLLAFFGFNALYATYLELNPKIRGIIIRPDSDGKKKINLRSYFNFIKQPITTQQPEVRKHLWHPSNWDINYPVCAIIFMVGYKIISKNTVYIFTKPEIITPEINQFFK